MDEIPDGLPEPEPDPIFARIHMEARIARLQINAELWEEFCRLVAWRCRLLFEALVVAGFSEDQALEVVKSWEVEDQE